MKKNRKFLDEKNEEIIQLREQIKKDRRAFDLLQPMIIAMQTNAKKIRDNTEIEMNGYLEQYQRACKPVDDMDEVLRKLERIEPKVRKIMKYDKRLIQ